MEAARIGVNDDAETLFFPNTVVVIHDRYSCEWGSFHNLLPCPQDHHIETYIWKGSKRWQFGVVHNYARVVLGVTIGLLPSVESIDPLNDSRPAATLQAGGAAQHVCCHGNRLATPNTDAGRMPNDLWLSSIHSSVCVDHNYQYVYVLHNYDATMNAMATQITGISTVCLTLCSGAHQRNHQSSASVAFVRGTHRWSVVPLTKSQWRGNCFHLMTSQ